MRKRLFNQDFQEESLMTDDDLAAWRRLNPGARINQPPKWAALLLVEQP